MRDLVQNNSALILVLGRFDISLGFGDKSVREVCRTHHVDEKTFLTVVNYVAGKDYNFKEIADSLSISVHTVTTHRRNISNKLQIHTTAGLTIYAIANKLVNIENIQVG